MACAVTENRRHSSVVAPRTLVTSVLHICYYNVGNINTRVRYLRKKKKRKNKNHVVGSPSGVVVGGKTCSPLFPVNEIYINGLLIFLLNAIFPSTHTHAYTYIYTTHARDCPNAYVCIYAPRGRSDYHIRML